MEITSAKNEKVVHMKKLGTNGSFRNENREFMCDGYKLLIEAMKCGIEIHDVFYCGAEPEIIAPVRNLYHTERRIIETISPLRTPQNVVFSAKIPQWLDEPVLKNAVILENVQDPGNVGTVIRTASAFYIKNVILVGSCADIWGPKTIRASMGAVFREKVFTIDLEILKTFKSKGAHIYAATLGQRPTDLREISLKECSVVIGNEGNGLTEQILDICDGNIIIPMSPGCESLNAATAASIFMWEMMRNEI